MLQSVRCQTLIPAGSNAKISREAQEIRAGFDYIRKHGPEDNSNGQFTVHCSNGIRGQSKSWPLYSPTFCPTR